MLNEMKHLGTDFCPIARFFAITQNDRVNVANVNRIIFNLIVFTSLYELNINIRFSSRVNIPIPDYAGSFLFCLLPIN